MKEKKKALIFLTKVGSEESNPEQYIRAHLLLAVLYKSLNEQELKDKHFAYATRMKKRQNDQLQKKYELEESQPSAQTSESPRVLRKLEESEVDELYFDLIESTLIPEGITSLASETLELIADTESPKVVKTKAKIMFGERKYEQVLEIIEEYLDDNKFDVDAIKLFADAYFLLNRYDESEKAFLRAVRRGANESLVKKKLGLIYIRVKKWREARTVFDDYCNNVNAKCAYAWRYLGMSAWKLRDIDGAQKSFEISNMLDNTNSETWGLLTIICLIIGVGQNRGFQSYQRAIKLGMNNFEIFAELGFLFSKTKQTHVDAVYCFEKAISLDSSHEDLWIQYGDFSKVKGKLKKALECYENALKCIKGEVKHKEVTERLDNLRNLYDQETKSHFCQMKNEANELNQIAAKH